MRFRGESLHWIMWGLDSSWLNFGVDEEGKVVLPLGKEVEGIETERGRSWE